MNHNPNRYFSARELHTVFTEHEFLIVFFGTRITYWVYWTRISYCFFGTRIKRIKRISYFRTKDSWDSRDSCSKFNIQHSTFNSIENGFTKLHQAGVSPALFSGFRPGRGKSPSDEMDSKMHPALWAAAEEWIQQELQGVQSSASILYFLPFGRTLIFISDNRWVSVNNNEHRWVGKMKCCIFAMWFRKRSGTAQRPLNINH